MSGIQVLAIAVDEQDVVSKLILDIYFEDKP